MRDFNADFADARDGKFAAKEIDELFEIQRWWVNYLAGNPRDQMAFLFLEEVRREIATRKSDARHNESLKVQQNLELSVNDSFRIAVWTLIVSVAVLIVAVLAWLFPKEQKKEPLPVVEP